MESTTGSADRPVSAARPPARKFINEATMFKILVEHDGLLLSITTKRRAFYFFLCRFCIDLRVAPTTDPFPGIVELSGYQIKRILENWDKMSNVLIPLKERRQIR